MYEIIADNMLLYSPQIESQGYIVTNPTLTKEVNRAGCLEFSIPPNHPFYGKLEKLRTIVRVLQNGIEIWRGRVLSTEKNFYLMQKIVCEGELAFLNDTLVPPYDYSNGITLGNYFTFLVNSYTNRCAPARMIQPGIVTNASSGTIINDYSESYTITLSELTNKLTDTAGGYLKIRRENGVAYLDYLDILSDRCDQVIEFGNNLIDLTEFIDASEVYSILLPLGKQDDDGNHLTISSVNGGSRYLVNQAAVNTFGPIVRTAEFSDIENPSTLLAEGQKILSKAVEAATTITVKAVDLYLLGAEVGSLDAGSIVRVKSAPHGIDADFLCSKVEINMESPDQSTYTFGLASSSLTDKQFNHNRKTQQQIDQTKSDLEDDIGDSLEESKSYTDKKWHEVTTSQDEFKVEYGRKITEIEDNITTVTEDVSNLSVRADEIATSVSQTKTELEGEIERSKTEMKSEVSQTASQIYAKVSSVETKADDAGTTASSAYSEAIMAANKVSLVVSGGSSSSSMTINPDFISLVSNKVEISSGISDIKGAIYSNGYGVYVAQSAGTLYLGQSGCTTYCKGQLYAGYMYVEGQLHVETNCVVDGQVHARSGLFDSWCYSPDWTNGSDRKLKTDIQELSEDLFSEFIFSLKPVEYRYKEDTSRKLRFGFIAQDIKEELKEIGYGDTGALVTAAKFKEDDEEETLTLSYTDIIAPLVSAVQSLHKKVEALTQEVEALKKGASVNGEYSELS